MPSTNAHQVDTECEISLSDLECFFPKCCWFSCVYTHGYFFPNIDSEHYFQCRSFSTLELGPISQKMTFPLTPYTLPLCAFLTPGRNILKQIQYSLCFYVVKAKVLNSLPEILSVGSRTSVGSEIHLMSEDINFYMN